MDFFFAFFSFFLCVKKEKTTKKISVYTISLFSFSFCALLAMSAIEMSAAEITAMLKARKEQLESDLAKTEKTVGEE